MQKKRLLLIIITSCMCLLSVDAFANKTRALERMVKGSEKVFKNQRQWTPNYAAGAKYINKRAFDKQDSLYLDSSKINEFYKNHTIQSQKPFSPKNLAPYKDDSFNDDFFEKEIIDSNNDSVPQQKNTDTIEQEKTAEKNLISDNPIAKDTSKSDIPPNNPAKEETHLHWILLLGFGVFILLIIYGLIKTFNKKGTDK